MEDKNKSKKQLIDEPSQMRQRITELEAIEEERRATEEVLKDREEMLRLSEEKYRTLIENLNVGVYRAAPGREGRFIDVNQAFVKILGYKDKEEVLKLRVSDIYCNPEDRKKFSDKISLQGSVRNEELLLKKKDGIPIITSDTAVTVYDKDGTLLYFDGIIEDITNRKKAEEALRTREEEFRLTFENAKDAIFWADPETGLIIKCNKAAEILLEKKREEIIGHHQTELHPEEKGEFYAEMFRKHTEQKGTLDDEAEVITKSGRIKPVHITASLTSVGGKSIVQGIFRDITERKRASQELKDSEEQYRSLVELAPEGIITLDTEGVVTSCNTSALKKTGYFSEEMIGKHFSMLKFLRKEDIAPYLALFDSVLRGKAPKTMETTFIGKNGTPYISEIRMKLLKRGKKTTGVLVMARDVTERKQTEKQLKTLFEASRLINSTMDMEEIFSFVSDSVQELVGFDHFMVFLVSEDKKYIHRAYAVGEIKDKTRGLTLKYGDGLVGSCIETRETVLLANAHKDKRAKKIPGVTEPFVSRIIIPLVIEDTCVGALHISKAVESAYDRKDVDVLKPLSEVISSAIKNSKLYDEITTFGEELERRIDERSRRIQILLDTRQRLQKERSWEKGLTTIVESMMNLGFDRCGIALVNSMRKTLDFQFGRGSHLPKKGTSVPLKDTQYFGVKSVAEKRTIYVKEYTPKEGKQLTSESDSFVWVPIIVQDEAFATLGADNKESGTPITEEDVKDLEILAGMCAAFIDRTRILVEPVAENRLKTETKYGLEPSECYLVVEKKPVKSLDIFCDLVTHGIPGFLVSRAHPEKIKRKYKLTRTPTLWLSQSGTEYTINPNDLSKLNYIIGDFTRKSDESVILLNGLEYLITQMGFETVVKHVEELKDIIIVNNSMLIIPIHETTLSLKERGILERGFTVL